MIEFNLVKENESELLREIAVKSFEKDKNRYGSFPPGIDSIEWHKNQSKSKMYYKIIYNAKIIGGIRIFNMKKGHYRLGAIFILPNYQNLGIGHRSIEFIENSYPDAKMWSLDTPYKSYNNHYFYEKHGYVKVGEIKPDENREFYLFLYEKDLRN